MKNKVLAFGVAFATVLLPVSIIVILNFFGDNRFEVPILKPLDPDCDSNSLFQSLSSYDSHFVPSQINLVAISNPGETTLLVSELIRVKENLEYSNKVSYLLIGADSVIAEVPSFINYLNHIDQFNPGSLCEMQVSEEMDLIKYFLVDSNGNIRGAYKSQNIDELDRIVVEIRIIEQNLVSNR